MRAKTNANKYSEGEKSAKKNRNYNWKQNKLITPIFQNEYLVEQDIRKTGHGCLVVYALHDKETGFIE